jgi:hypothetical protein
MLKECRMEKTTEQNGCNTERNGEPMEERGDRANAVCNEACAECGVKVSCWSDFDAREEFIEGRIDETELNKRAASEIGVHAQAFGKYLVIDKDEPESMREETHKRDRAKQANKIYRKVCDEAGMTLCFFSDFSSWRDFVKGSMSDGEFYDRAREEAQKITESSQNQKTA